MSPHGTGRVTVYVGGAPGTELARRVLECSIIRRTEMKVDFVHMQGREWSYDEEGLPEECLPGELARWLIPSRRNWQGVALYLDAACLVTGDIWDLWTKPRQTCSYGKSTLWCPYYESGGTALPCTAVMLVDCDKARGQWPFDLPEVLRYVKKGGLRALHDIRHARRVSQEPVHLGDWMSMDFFQSGKTKLIHYPDAPEQPWPWRTGIHPYAQPWEMELSVALHAGFVPVELLELHLSLWVEGCEKQDPRAMHPEYKRFIPKRQGKSGIIKREGPRHGRDFLPLGLAVRGAEVQGAQA